MLRCRTGDWAAFVQASVVQPEAPAAPVVSHDSWDAFQSSDAAAPTATEASAPLPFDPFGESQASTGQKASGAGVSAPAAVMPSSASAAKHATKKSADDIMKMFDTPQQNAFAPFPVQGMSGVTQPQAGAVQAYPAQVCYYSSCWL